jgi:hypothetical protein
MGVSTGAIVAVFLPRASHTGAGACESTSPQLGCPVSMHLSMLTPRIPPTLSRP